MAKFKKDGTAELDFLHVSMQFSDNTKQKNHDARVIFAQGADIVTGTEAGTGKSMDLRRALKKESKKAGYTFFVKGDTWVSIKREIIDGRKSVEKGAYGPIVPGQAGRWTTKYVTYTTFDGIDGLGTISVGVGHYLTKGRPVRNALYRVNLKWNQLYAKGIGRFAKEKGRGTKLAFYAGDQNIVDRTDDTFFGEPMTSSWDELHKWENTGHGNIDVIASYDKDGRVSWKSVDALPDKELFLHTDHYAVKSTAVVRLLKH